MKMLLRNRKVGILSILGMWVDEQINWWMSNQKRKKTKKKNVIQGVSKSTGSLIYRDGGWETEKISVEINLISSYFEMLNYQGGQTKAGI